MRKFLLTLVLLVVASGVWLLKNQSSSDAKKDLNVIFGGVGYEMTSAQEYVGQWSKLSNAPVSINSAVRGTDNRLQQYLPHLKTKSMDVYQVDVTWAPMFADFMEDLNQHFSAEELSVFNPSLRNAATVDGRLIFLPLYVQWMVLYVRTDLLEKYGRGVPTTWAELEETSAFIMNEENKSVGKGESKTWGLVFMGQPYEGLTCLTLSVLGSSGSGVNVFDPSENVESVQKALMRMHKWMHGAEPITPTGVLSYTQEGARQAFQRGGAVFMINWPYAKDLMSVDGSPIKGKFSVVALPSDGRGPAPIFGGAGVSVSKYSGHKKEAIDLIRFLTSAEVQMGRYEKYGYISARSDVSCVPAGQYSMVPETLKCDGAVARPASSFKKWSAVGFKMGAAFYAFLNNVNAEVQTAFQKVQAVLKTERKGGI